MKEIIDNIIRVFMILIIILFLGLIIFNFKVELKSTEEPIEITKEEKTTTPKIDKVVVVGCGTNSMGMTMGCNDRLYVRNIKKNEIYQEGDIYIFNSPYSNGTTVHRLVKDCRNNCSGLIFKGDNNYAADPIINESDVKYKVMKVELR